MRRVYVALPFIVPVANVLLDWFLSRRIGAILTCSQLIPSVGIAKYLSLPHDAQRSRYNRFVLLYFAFIVGSLSGLQHLMRGTRGGILAAFASHWITSDFFAIYMVLLRIAAIQPGSYLVLVTRRTFWGMLAITCLLSILVIFGTMFALKRTDDARERLFFYGAPVIAVYCCVFLMAVGMAVLCAMVVRTPVRDLRQALKNGEVQGFHQVIVAKALRMARLQQCFALVVAISTLSVYTSIIYIGLYYIIGGTLMELLSEWNGSSYTKYTGFYVIGGTSLVNRAVNDLAMYMLAFSSATFVVTPSRRDFDALGQLTAVAGIARRLLEDAGDDESFHAVEPGGNTRYISRIEPRPRPPDAYPSTPIWRISGGNVSRATLSRACEGADGSWVWEDTESAKSGGLVDGVYQFVACYGEEFLRAALDNDHSTLAAGATVLMAGTLEVSGGVLDLWTNTSNTFRPLAYLVMQAKLPPERLWLFCPAGSTMTDGHDIRPLGDGRFLERFLRVELSPAVIPANPGTAAHDNGNCVACIDYTSDRCEHLSCPRCHHPAHKAQALVEKRISEAKDKRRREKALTMGKLEAEMPPVPLPPVRSVPFRPVPLHRGPNRPPFRSVPEWNGTGRFIAAYGRAVV